MLACRYRHGQRAYGTEVPLRPLVSLVVQPLVFQLGRALLAGLFVDLAVGLLAVHATVFDEEAGRAVFELHAVATFLPAVCAHISSCCRLDAGRCHGGKPVKGEDGVMAKEHGTYNTAERGEWILPMPVASTVGSLFPGLVRQ